MSQTQTGHLSPKQQRIIARIRDLHAAQSPLNIAAMGRRYPDLIPSLHAMKPFWSWKDALAAAGVSYAKIRRELERTCSCPYCDAEKANLATHLYTAHHIRPQTFRAEHPDLSLTAEQLRANKSSMRSSVLAHWEPLWSREYLLERAHEFHQRGLPLHAAWIAVHDQPFYSAGIRYFRRWNVILEAIGLDPAVETQKGYLASRRYPDKAAVVAEILRRHRVKWPINSSGVRPDVVPRDSVRRGKTGTGPSAAQGRQPRVRRVDPPLWLSAREYFGSWHEALKAAGFNPDEVHRAVRPKAKYTQPSAVRLELRRRHRAGQSLRLADVLRPPAEDSALVTAARAFFGAWAAALKAAGVPQPPPRRTRPSGPKPRYPDKPGVLKAIRRRKRARLPLNAKAMVKAKSADSALLLSACKHFGSWNKALAAAGLNPATIRLRTGPKPRRPGYAQRG